MRRPTNLTCFIRQATAARARDRGATSIEMIGFAIPAAVAAILVIYAAFLVGLSSIDVTTAASAAARAASQQRTFPAAATAARQAAAANLSAKKITCWRLEVSTDPSGWSRGGTVTVTVRCTSKLKTVAGMDFLPGTYTSSAKATAVLETYRSVVFA